ncbi:hypothetical protein D3C71_1238670 [compost metagenome]
MVEQGLSGIVRVAGQAHKTLDASLPVQVGWLDDVLIHLRQQYIQAMPDVTRQQGFLAREIVIQRANRHAGFQCHFPGGQP